MSGDLRFHHVGVAVADFEGALAFYSMVLGFRLISGPFDDPIQKVKVCFVGNPEQGTAPIEIISPLGSASPVNSYLAKGIGAYHVCFEVAGLEQALTDLRSKGCLLISGPVPAVAFAGRSIAWCFTPTKQLIELVERHTAPAK
jgi:methylmalonyl-CoA/ethylmalonyl-CoA epimerase